MNVNLIFQSSTGTIRQMPQNYLVAHWDINKWVSEPDMAVSVDTMVLMTRALADFNTKFSKDGNVVIAKMEQIFKADANKQLKNRIKNLFAR